MCIITKPILRASWATPIVREPAQAAGVDTRWSQKSLCREWLVPAHSGDLGAAWRTQGPRQGSGQPGVRTAHASGQATRQDSPRPSVGRSTSSFCDKEQTEMEKNKYVLHWIKVTKLAQKQSVYQFQMDSKGRGGPRRSEAEVPWALRHLTPSSGFRPGLSVCRQRRVFRTRGRVTLGSARGPRLPVGRAC